MFCSGENAHSSSDRYELVIDAVVSTAAQCRTNIRSCQMQSMKLFEKVEVAFPVEDEDGTATWTKFGTASVNVVNVSKFDMEFVLKK